MSGLPLKADIGACGQRVRYGPLAGLIYSMISSARPSQCGRNRDRQRLGRFQVDHQLRPI